jgi:hypothetical protein
MNSFRSGVPRSIPSESDESVNFPINYELTFSVVRFDFSAYRRNVRCGKQGGIIVELILLVRV